MIEFYRKNMKVIVGILIILVCLMVGYSALSDARYYRTVEEVAQDPVYYSSHEVNMIGVIVNGTLEQVSAQKYRFRITDNNATIDVVYYNVLPRTFNREGTIVVIGKMNQTRFEATEMQVKCPTKYDPESE